MIALITLGTLAIAAAVVVGWATRIPHAVEAPPLEEERDEDLVHAMRGYFCTVGDLVREPGRFGLKSGDPVRYWSPISPPTDPLASPWEQLHSRMALFEIVQDKPTVPPDPAAAPTVPVRALAFDLRTDHFYSQPVVELHKGEVPTEKQRDLPTDRVTA